MASGFRLPGEWSRFVSAMRRPHLLLVHLVAIVLLGCSRTPAPEATVDAGTLPGAPERLADLRIVSLSPALTETLVALGLGDVIVGRSTFCTDVPATIPVAGDLRDFDAERLVQLAPTDIVVQPPSAGIDPGLVELATRQRWRLHGHRLDTIDDIRHAATALGASLAPADAEDAARLAHRAAALVEAIDTGLQAVAARPVPATVNPVLLLFATDPPMAFGRRTYLGEVLERIGGVNAVRNGDYPELSLEDVVGLQPATIVLVRADATQPSAPALASLSVPAIRDGRLLTLVEPRAMRPGPSVVVVAEALRALLAGDGPAP